MSFFVCNLSLERLKKVHLGISLKWRLIVYLVINIILKLQHIKVAVLFEIYQLVFFLF